MSSGHSFTNNAIGISRDVSSLNLRKPDRRPKKRGNFPKSPLTDTTTSLKPTTSFKRNRDKLKMKPCLSMQELGYREKLRPKRNVGRPLKKSTSSKESFTPSFEDKENVPVNLENTKVALSNLEPPKIIPTKSENKEISLSSRDLLDRMCKPPRPNLNESLEKLSVDDSDIMSPVNNRFCSSPMIKPKVVNQPEQKTDEEDSDVEILARNNKPVIQVDEMEMSMNQSYTCLPQSAKKLVTDHGLPKISPFR